MSLRSCAPREGSRAMRMPVNSNVVFRMFMINLYRCRSESAWENQPCIISCCKNDQGQISFFKSDPFEAVRLWGKHSCLPLAGQTRRFTPRPKSLFRTMNQAEPENEKGRYSGC